eukprot:gnl/MRDRNA2_/MRDRNA2_108246_c0_seq1.p1 gnl/MRDRNA2_/MRDRNA2_108246_c0~~gnl/MRDRNA2_/MRDRNA2_108246_c0_seq1.p1  ORF type:complete len:548 (-),score=112.27 gnl/MRDRNA2_/MRDRNA2_108246_c0_seq1:140-1783(-)
MAAPEGEKEGSTEVQENEEDSEYIGMVHKFTVSEEESGVAVNKSKSKKWVWEIHTGDDKMEIWTLTVMEEKFTSETGILGKALKVTFFRDKDKQFESKNFTNDYTYKKDMRGCVPDMLLAGKYEVYSMDGHEEWFPATLTSFRSDKRYGCIVKVPNNDPNDEAFGEIEEKEYPVVDVRFIRNASDKKPVRGPGTVIQLDVKVDNVWNPSLTNRGKNWLDAGFYVPMPRPGKPQKDIEFKVSKNYEEVTGEYSYELMQSIAGNVVHKISESPSTTSDKDKNVDKTKHSWKMFFGAALDHTISIEVQKTEFTLKVDDETFVLCDIDDLGGQNKISCKLTCKFVANFAFHVHQLEHGVKSTDTIVQKDVEREFEYQISIACSPSELSKAEKLRLGIEQGRVGIWDLSKAELMVNEKMFAKLSKLPKAEDKKSHTYQAEIMENEFGLDVPRAASEGEGLMNELQSAWEEFKDWIPHDQRSLNRFLIDVNMMCCKSGKQHPEHEVGDNEDLKGANSVKWNESSEVIKDPGDPVSASKGDDFPSAPQAVELQQ